MKRPKLNFLLDKDNTSHLGSGLEKRVAIFVESRGESQVDSAAASQDGLYNSEAMTKKKNSKDVELMTDAEFEALTREIAGEQVKIPEIAFDPRYMEKRDNPTPSGGDYSIVYYYNDDDPCEKSRANRVNIVEYKNGGIRINEHYGLLGRSGKNV